MKLTFVAALAENRVIGSRNDLPWHIPEDLKHFRQVTQGKPCLMGKNTFDSIMNRLGKPLPGRKNIVISRQADYSPPAGVLKFDSPAAALKALQDEPEVMVIGGGQIYAQLIDQADKLLLTEVHRVIDGDVFFPEFDKAQWQKVSEEPHDGFSFVEYAKIKP